MYRRDTFTIHRLTASGSTKQYATTATTITGQLEPTGSEFISMADGAFGKTFVMVSPQTEVTVNIGDRLIRGSEQYEVKGLQVNRRYTPNITLQLIEAQV